MANGDVLGFELRHLIDRYQEAAKKSRQLIDELDEAARRRGRLRVEAHQSRDHYVLFSGTIWRGDAPGGSTPRPTH